MPGAAQPIPIGCKGGKRGRVPREKQPVICFVFAGQLRHRLCQRNALVCLPLQLRHHRARRRGKDQGAVPLAARSADQPLPGFHSLPGGYQHSAAGKICTQHRSVALCPQPMQRACGDLGAGMGRGSFHRKPAFFKIQACPRELAAFQQGILSAAQQLLGYGSAGLQAAVAQHCTRPRPLPGGQAAVVHRPYKSLQPDQHQPPSDKPRPKPLAPQQRTQQKIKPHPFFHSQPHPPVPGKCGQPPVLPSCAMGAKAAGQGRNAI